MCLFYLNGTATTENDTEQHTLSQHDALPISVRRALSAKRAAAGTSPAEAVLMASMMGSSSAGGWRGKLNRRLTGVVNGGGERSEEHTSELQSLMRISYAVFCLKKNT